ncbi:V-set domain-containing T-cell activation inhibitor 1-like isoform X2 [Myripristis murdjan]|nr:V-set domain-containing T-cell activation inhibitor 1-like isoform X2 [Myripristis murdjan]XP_029934675.1 V-set domain-containing T-cell activation inhibitor 1-like isoform X2 [Myripristis murdjan]XP_029934676.1 V-set domain-containing T-cell activation inhibitor 1-like isoform X2 [Myripristis murdjan]
MWYKKKAVVSCTRYGDTHFVIGHNSPADMYRGRTDLYADQVLQGNATLLLRDITPQDQGKYFCITMTAPRTDESGVISLVIKAPVREVHIERLGDSVSCSAGGIYPAPAVSWSTEPPTDAQNLQNSTRTQINLWGFYDIHSSLRLLGNNAEDLTYICSVTSDMNKRTAFLKHQAPIQASPSGDVVIPCGFPVPRSFNLTWSFNRLEPILSLSVSGQKAVLSVRGRWAAHVLNRSSPSSGLQLHSLQLQHQGAYTCELSTADETHVSHTNLTFTGDGESSGQVFIYVVVIGMLSYFLLMSYGTLVFLLLKLRRQDRGGGGQEPSTELQELNQSNGGVEINTAR